MSSYSYSLITAVGSGKSEGLTPGLASWRTTVGSLLLVAATSSFHHLILKGAEDGNETKTQNCGNRRRPRRVLGGKCKGQDHLC